ncbi:hypothetical protein PIB30_040206 [Stylosanthes scabra]|uniref:Aminotransferase-like plant mobile domain-containing protein n=1 Tax=Stylosanthes scabra TaxID=79078 RepID=A0ABU6RF25_9FABA|nr:hypothetical protein [Stylosanthes scabra]
MAQPTLEEIAAADRNIMYRLDSIAHVSRNINRDPIRCLSTVRRQQPMYLDPRAEPYLERAGLLPLARLCDAWFKLDDLGQYSWGSATLAWLYRNLCRASNRNVVAIVGPLQLLQSWIF